MSRLHTEGHLHRYEGRNKKRTPIWTRHYARIETAVECATRYLMQHGHPGDLIECTRKRDGLQVAVVHLKVSGQIEILWNFKEAQRERAKYLMEKGL